MKICVFLVLAFVAAAHGGLFIKDGQEYVYQSSATTSAGTMDHSPHMSGSNYKMKVRVQVSGKTLNVQISDIQMTQYVGPVDVHGNPFDSTSYTNVPAGPMSFSVTSDDDGKFKSLNVQSGLTTFQKNLIRGWAAQLQINAGEIKRGNKAFVSTEQTLHGECDISYTVTDAAVYKSVAHMKDCKNRKFRKLDDWRGYRCDIDYRNPGKIESTDGLYSHSTSVYYVEKDGDGFAVKKMVTNGGVIAQFFESEGVSHFSWVNITSVLVDQKSSSGDISASGESFDSLEYEFEDASYKWNENRDLKAREPFFSSGEYFSDDQAETLAALKRGLDAQKQILHTLENTPEAIQKAHQYGIQTLYPAVYALNYDSLKNLADELLADKSEDGVMKANLFLEILGAAGSTAGALVVRDLVLENKFDNDRDAARTLSAVPFHIRRPNTQLVQEYEKLLTFTGQGSERFVEMAIPLAFGHLVKTTCMRAGDYPAIRECFGSFASKYVSKFWNDYKSATTREEKALALSVLQNIKFGGIAEKLKPLIYGQLEGETSEMRSHAIWAAGWDAAITGNGIKYFMPIFADKSIDHEIRLSAVAMVFYSRPSSTDISTIMAILKTEKDYEVVNYVFTLMEKFANSINPCEQKTGETVKYFLKYLKQFSEYETDWGFGVSKTFQRQFHKAKFGYTGTYSFYSIGSHKSTTPLCMGMGISTNLFHTYENNMLGIHLRVEGLAKGLIRKFKTMDPSVWKTADLESILSSEMNIRERPDQPVRVAVMFMLKGTVVFHRLYDETSTKEGGKITQFIESLTGLDETYTINHQRVFQVGTLLYEQPTDIGIPMAYINGITTMADIKATVKRGILRGLIYRNVDYDVHFFTQGVNIMMVQNPARKVSYGIVQDRIYHAHFPRKLVLGLNPSRKELKISIERPAYNDPTLLMMHSQTAVIARGNNVAGTVKDLKQNCPSCESRVIVSKGPDAAVRRVFINRDNEKMGYNVQGEYFDCELDVSRSTTIGRAIAAFTPYNKNPKTLWTSIAMGVRQIRAFFIYFPKAEKCGALFRFSQSINNPVKEIEISLRAQADANGERMFFRGRKWMIRAVVKAIGDTATRSYRISLSYDFTPGYIQNRFKLMINRAPLPALDISAYTVCVAYESKYPDFTKEFLGVDFNEELEVTGKGMVQYGEGTECDQGEGEIRMKFRHTTTQAAREDLKKKWYYQQCMAAKNSPAWRGRAADGLPVSEACYMTAFDATRARKYTWNIEFVKLTSRMSHIISKVQSLVKAGLMPYWDIDPEEIDSDGKPGPFMNIEANFHNSDRSLDVKMETSQGVNEFKDYPLSMDWNKRLRNLKFTKTIKNLMDLGILSPCIADSASVRTNDNVTYPISFSDCWTLVSGHCGPTPSYAVFTKKVSGSKPLALKAYIGGHSIEINAAAGSVLINGSPVTLEEDKEHEHTEAGQEIFKVFRWGSTYNVYSFLRVWLAFDGNFVEVMPAPSVKGQHCGVCGNYNKNKFDEFTGKEENQLVSAADMVNEWKWKC
jgi:hypothetical protein